MKVDKSSNLVQKAVAVWLILERNLLLENHENTFKQLNKVILLNVH